MPRGNALSNSDPLTFLVCKEEGEAVQRLLPTDFSEQQTYRCVRDSDLSGFGTRNRYKKRRRAAFADISTVTITVLSTVTITVISTVTSYEYRYYLLSLALYFSLRCVDDGHLAPRA